MLVIRSSETFNESHELFEDLLQWQIVYVNGQIPPHTTSLNLIKKEDIHFLVFSREPGQSLFEEIASLHKAFPLLLMIYYFPQLKNIEFAQLYESGFHFCIVGDARQVNLIRTLKNLWNEHWRRLPDWLAPETKSKQCQEMIQLIEGLPIDRLNAEALAVAMNMEERPFRRNFQDNFGYSFKTFKKRLFTHYEQVLLFEKQLSARQTAEALRYKHLSSFSRSFKNRHGQSWQNLKLKNLHKMDE